MRRPVPSRAARVERRHVLRASEACRPIARSPHRTGSPSVHACAFIPMRGTCVSSPDALVPWGSRLSSGPTGRRVENEETCPRAPSLRGKVSHRARRGGRGPDAGRPRALPQLLERKFQAPRWLCVFAPHRRTHHEGNHDAVDPSSNSLVVRWTHCSFRQRRLQRWPD